MCISATGHEILTHDRYSKCPGCNVNTNVTKHNLLDAIAFKNLYLKAIN